ncbi:MAG: hypothetical protein Q8R15_05155 [Candidatus Micrarchaeota archaeon]|nr:hypothetical protein [Candidatus Micrarchaeota archaeon]
MAEMIVVIRIRGSMETRQEIEDTLSQHLHVTRRMHAAVFTTNIAGWLQKAKDYITWGFIDADTYKQLIAKRGDGKEQKLYRLHPPKGGFKKSTKIAFPKGELGKRDAESMKKLLLRML